MKYKEIHNHYDDQNLELSLACTSCDSELGGKEKFCPNCGKKLSPLPAKIPYSFLVGLLSKTFKNQPAITPDKADGDAPSKPIDNINSTTPSHDPTEKCKSPTDTTPFKPTRSCPRCQPSPNGCPYLDNGICRGVVYPTFPPQYDPCVFPRL